MSPLDIAAVVIGVGGIAFGLNCYRELHKWARMCQNGRITIAYKRKVKLDAPLTEWLGWMNMLKKDKLSGGRVIYSMGGTSVAILKAPNKQRRRKEQPARQGEYSSIDQSKQPA